jgi:hypothetical protein
MVGAVLDPLVHTQTVLQDARIEETLQERWSNNLD